MSKSMNDEQRELLASQMNAGKDQDSPPSSKNTQLRERIQYDQFTIVGEQEVGYFIALGRYRLTDGGETLEECKRKIDEKDWDLIFNVTHLIVDQLPAFNAFLQNELNEEKQRLKEQLEKAVNDNGKS